MLVPLRKLLPGRFQKLSKTIKRQAGARGAISKSDFDKHLDFFAPEFDGVGQIEELRDVILCIDALRIDETGTGDGAGPQRERERPQYRGPSLS